MRRDKDSKQRLKAFDNVGMPITATAFNRNGTMFAYAVGYDWSKGVENRKQSDLSKEKIYLYSVRDDDIKPKRR